LRKEILVAALRDIAMDLSACFRRWLWDSSLWILLGSLSSRMVRFRGTSLWIPCGENWERM